MIKAVIIDDEQHCIERIHTLLQSFKDTMELVATYTTVEAAIQGINAKKPNLLFLDVQIHNRMGFEVLTAIHPYNFEVIFTTAHEVYAVQAFKFSAVDYLLKPIDADDFAQAIEKVSQKLNANDFYQKMEVLLSNLPKKDTLKKLSVPTEEGLIFLEVSNIIRFEADVNYTIIHTLGSHKLTVAKTLKRFEELLANCNFFRVHNSHLINLEYISKYTKGKGGYLTMTDGVHIEVSTRRKEEFLKAIGSL